MNKPNLNKAYFEIFPEKKELVLQGKCTTCQRAIIEENFEPIEKAEYSVSGMCELCQRSVFGHPKGRGR